MPFACTKCDKTFIRAVISRVKKEPTVKKGLLLAPNVTRHLTFKQRSFRKDVRTYAVKKPFGLNKCDQTFVLSYDLKKHD